MPSNESRDDQSTLSSVGDRDTIQSNLDAATKRFKAADTKKHEWWGAFMSALTESLECDDDVLQELSNTYVAKAATSGPEFDFDPYMKYLDPERMYLLEGSGEATSEFERDLRGYMGSEVSTEKGKRIANKLKDKIQAGRSVLEELDAAGKEVPASTLATTHSSAESRLPAPERARDEGDRQRWTYVFSSRESDAADFTRSVKTVSRAEPRLPAFEDDDEEEELRSLV